MRVGFTGTRNGLTDKQEERLRYYLEPLNITMGLHGGCIGADEIFHQIVKREREIYTVVRPCNLGAFLKFDFSDADEIFPEEDPLYRNRLIVKDSELLIACPKEYKDVPRGSGTWYTYRNAKKLGKETVMIFPNGGIV